MKSGEKGKLSGLKLTPRKKERQTDPEKLFRSLTLRGGVENIWEPQAAALRQWHAKRAEARTILEMNTGGGKTLIALLTAQSLVNETRGSVLYVCPTIQLIEQTRVQAKQCGLETAAYYAGSWKEQDVFTESRGPCVTNYAALCNGKSIFRREKLDALILDDAHVASPSIRSSFTLRFPAQTDSYDSIVSVFKPYFDKAGHAQQLTGLLEGDPIPLLFVPSFEVNRRWQQVTKILKDGKVDEERSTLFVWEHLKDKIDRCCILISASAVEISPADPPINALPQLSNCPRIIYMTATLPSPVQFSRTFGPITPNIIRPEGKSGEAQRLFVFAEGETNEEQREWTKQLIRSRKSCIIGASRTHADQWTDEATLYLGDTGNAGLEAFKRAQPPEKLVMAARYDGIDLPGDSCRVLVLDGLPLGSLMIDRFTDEVLHVEGIRSSSTAIRVTQAIGRIFRSNTDHGVVILCGTDLQNWVSAPQNQAHLPDLLQRHLQFALELRKLVKKGQTTYEDLMHGILTGEPDWDRLYSEIGEYDTEERPSPPEWLIEAAGKENAAFGLLWTGNFTEAAQHFSLLVDEVEAHDRGLGAWYRHWLGFTQERLGQGVSASQAYTAAANDRGQLGRPSISSKTVMATPSTRMPGTQAKAIALLAQDFAGAQKVLAKVKRDLVYGNDTRPAEAALYELGRMLGLSASRPDNAKPKKTGPDVLWRFILAKAGVALELKTDKKAGSNYTKKDDIGQFHDHVQYLSKNHSDEAFLKVIVGRLLPVSRESHPAADLRIIELEEFKKLTARVVQLYEYINASTDGDELSVRAQRLIEFLGLEWPKCLDGLAFSLASDLQRDETTTDEIL
jgi:hypothetical protein